MLKIMKSEQSESDVLSRGSMGGSKMANNVVGMGEMKGMLRDSLMKNVKTYDTIDTSQDGHHNRNS